MADNVDELLSSAFLLQDQENNSQHGMKEEIGMRVRGDVNARRPMILPVPEHKLRPSYRCQECDFVGQRRSNLNQHMQSKHPGTLFQCELCDYASAVKHSLEIHRREFHAANRFACPDCAYTASEAGNLRKHVESVHLGLRYSCTVCGKSFSRTEGLRRHHRNVHGYMSSASRATKYNAAATEQPPAATRTLTQSTAISDDDEAFVGFESVIAEPLSETASCLNDDEESIAVVPAAAADADFDDGFADSTTTAAFMSAAVVDDFTHEDIVAEPLRHDEEFGANINMASIGGRQHFGRRSSALSNQNLSVIVRPNGPFVRNNNNCKSVIVENKHIVKNASKAKQINIDSNNSRASEAFRYSCDQCDFSALALRTIRDHIRSDHFGQKYSCDQCTYEAARPNTLKRHKEIVHFGLRYPCTQCTFVANEMQTLNAHLVSSHLGIRHTCHECGQSYTTVQSLCRHKLTAHATMAVDGNNGRGRGVGHFGRNAAERFLGTRNAQNNTAQIPLPLRLNRLAAPTSTVNHDAPSQVANSLELVENEEPDYFVGRGDGVTYIKDEFTSYEVDNNVRKLRYYDPFFQEFGKNDGLAEYPGSHAVADATPALPSAATGSYQLQMPQDGINLSSLIEEYVRQPPDGEEFGVDTEDIGDDFVEPFGGEDVLGDGDEGFEEAIEPVSFVNDEHFKAGFTKHLAMKFMETEQPKMIVVGEKAHHKCAECGFVASTRRSLHLHISQKHRMVGHQQCDQCEYVAPSLVVLQKHKIAKHTERKYKCTQCSFDTNHQGNLTKHVRVKHDGIRYRCHVCNFSTTRSNILKHHITKKHQPQV